MTDPDRKGGCYQLAFEAVALGDDLGRVLVHGWPVLQGGPHQGSRYGHAWVEFDVSDALRCVWDPVGDAVLPRELYYQAGQIEPDHCTRYLPEQARAQAVDTGTYGPWPDPPRGMQPLFAEEA